MAITVSTASASISTTEVFLFANSTTASYQTTDAWMQVQLDLTNLVAGDDFRFRIYEKIDGTNARVVEECSLVGVRGPWVSPGFLMGNGYEASLIRVAGSDRTIPWSIWSSSGNVTVTSSSFSISTTEYFLFSASTTATYQTTDAVMQTMIDFSNMAVGDTYVVKVYEKIDGTNARVIEQTTLDGTQSKAWVNPALFVGNGYEVSVTRTAGTDRSILWSTRVAV